MPVQTRSGKKAAKPHRAKKAESVDVGGKRESEPASAGETDRLPEKRQKIKGEDVSKYFFHPGVVERGHIYFFHRPTVQHKQVHGLDDVRNLHMLLAPRPPQFSVYEDQAASTSREESVEKMTVVSEGADVIPAAETLDQCKKHYRLLTIGKKRLPEAGGVFWTTVIAVGDDLHNLERGLGEKTYETKTRGVRHEGAVRLAGRGVYAIVNKAGPVPSKNATHLAFHLTHPSTLVALQESLGIHTASSFVVQVKNPLADALTYGQRVGLPVGKRAQYPDEILDHVFERGSLRHEYGLRFASCHCIELLEYEGAELLMIGARDGVAGSDASLGERRGEALKEAGEGESQEPVDEIFRELAMDREAFPAEALEGRWI